MSQTERRCPSCGALVTLDAAWCGQCLRPLPDAEPEREISPGPDPASELETEGPTRVAADRDEEAQRTEPTWPCPACGHVNAIALDRCEVCGTPFARLFAEPESLPQIGASRALAWSLLWPGLGHWMAGRRLDGLARMVLFAWTAGAVVVLLTPRSGRGLGPVGPLLGLYAVAAVLVYGLSAVDARRTASGTDPLVSSRALLWGSVGLIVLSVALATLLSLPAARGG